VGRGSGGDTEVQCDTKRSAISYDLLLIQILFYFTQTPIWKQHAFICGEQMDTE